MHVVPNEIIRQMSVLPTHISLEPLFPALIPMPDFPMETPDTLQAQPVEDTYEKVGINRVLQDFIRREKKGRDRRVKLENVRYRVMRGLKKALRALLGLSKRSLRVRLLPKETKQTHSAFEEFRKWAEVVRDEARKFAELGNGPKADSHRPTRLCRFSTYNNAYMREVFQSREIRLIYRLYVSVIFSEEDSESLCERLKLACCSGSQHSKDCYRKWSELRTAFHQYLGAEVTRVTETLQDLQASL